MYPVLPRTLTAAAAFALAAAACTPHPPVDRAIAQGSAAPLSAGPAADETAVEGSAATAPPVAEAPPAPAPLPSVAERERALQALRTAATLAGAGAHREALARYDGVARAVPAFGDWAQLLAADAARQARDGAEVARRMRAISPGSSAAEWGWRTEVRALAELGDPAAALEAATRAGRELPAGPAAAAAWARAGELRAARGDARGAAEDFRRAMRMAPESPGGLQAARGAHDLPGLAPEDHLLIGRTLLRHGGTERGVPMVERFLRSGAGSGEERADAQLHVGRVLFNARRYPEAIPHLRAAAAVRPEASFLLGRSLFRAGDRSGGADGFMTTAQRFPRDPAAAEALLTLGDLARDDGQFSRARSHYAAAVATGVHTQAAADAAVRGAAVALRQGDARAALAGLEAYLAERPRDRFSVAALYWAGRAHQETGARDAARERYRQALDADPYSYYGVRAADRLGTSISAVALPPAPAMAAATRDEVDGAFFRIDLLRDLRMNDEAEFELARVRERMSADPAGLAAVAAGMVPRGQPIAATLLAVRIHRENGAWNEPLLRLAYPFHHRDLIEREARRNGLDPFVVAGLIRQESLFNAVAVSPAGAIGLMQVMPATGRGLARRVGVANYTPALLHQPEVNVRMGTLFLADQMRRWGGHEPDVFAAYNAGPGRVVRWREFPEHRDEDLYVERIPFAETRDYVKKVRANARIYRALYGER
jgi:soluble lytic murein transglycosylase-like protein